MAYIDISLSLSNDLPVWPGDPSIDLKKTMSMDNGDPCNVTHLNMGVHAGTHIDSPHHFLNNNITVEKMRMETLIGTVFVVEILENISIINSSVLENSNIPLGIDKLLIKTKNSLRWKTNDRVFHKKFIAIEKSGAEWIVERNIKLIGVDYLSVAPFNDGAPTHRVLLEKNVIVVEGLNLYDVTEGYYELICLPLKILGSDGAPARAVLKTIDNLNI